MAQDDLAMRLVALSFAASDPLSLARFWAEALRWEVDDGEPDDIGLVPTDGTRFRVRFRPVAEPKAGLDRAHLDLTTTSDADQEETVARLLGLGGRHLDIGQGPDVRHVVLADPEGNEFCVIDPENAFLAGCGRLGAISCDGTQEVGYFWSRVLGWPLIWDQDEETAVRAPDGTGPIISWGGPPVSPKVGRNRLRLDIAPPGDVERAVAVERLEALGATRIDIGQGDVDWVVMADPDDNDFCVVHP